MSPSTADQGGSHQIDVFDRIGFLPLFCRIRQFSGFCPVDYLNICSLNGRSAAVRVHLQNTLFCFASCESLRIDKIDKMHYMLYQELLMVNAEQDNDFHIYLIDFFSGYYPDFIVSSIL